MFILNFMLDRDNQTYERSESNHIFSHHPILIMKSIAKYFNGDVAHLFTALYCTLKCLSIFTFSTNPLGKWKASCWRSNSG